jgi:hypothetical protein
VSRSLLVAPVLVALFATAAAAAAAPGEVRVPRDVAREAVPPPFARTCVVSFDELATVDAACPMPVYEESWEGPLLLARNLSQRTIWVSYVYRDLDGRRYHGPCYELPSRTTRAIPDQAIRPLAPRQVHVTITPGPGYPRDGFQLSCRDRRTVVD